jgi:hypothetical protein
MSEVIRTVPCMPCISCEFHVRGRQTPVDQFAFEAVRAADDRSPGLVCILLVFPEHQSPSACPTGRIHVPDWVALARTWAPATYARDVRLFGAFPTESALPLRTAHVISAISSPGPFLLLARKLYACRPRQPESAVRGVPQPSSQPDAWKMCIVQESSDDRKSPSPEVLVAQSGSLAWCLPYSIQGTVPVPPARYLGHGCLHSWAFACRSWIVDRGSWIGPKSVVKLGLLAM